jgi:hypothetical protein
VYTCASNLDIGDVVSIYKKLVVDIYDCVFDGIDKGVYIADVNYDGHGHGRGRGMNDIIVAAMPCQPIYW